MHPSTFDYLIPTTEQVRAMGDLRKSFKRLAEDVEALVPEGRYRSIAITALEEAAMHANKGITRHSDGSPRVDIEAEIREAAQNTVMEARPRSGRIIPSGRDPEGGY